MRYFYIGGMDGTGKSTQTRLLVKHLKSMGLSVMSCHVYGVLLLRIISHLRTKKNTSTTDIPDGRELKPIKGLRRMIAYFSVLDVFTFMLFFRIVSRITNCVVIFDRCAYDYYLRQRLAGFDSRIIETAYRGLLPKYGVILDASTDTVYKRKPEFSLEQFEFQARCFTDLARRQGYRIISTEMSINSTHEEIKAFIERLL